MCDLLSAFTGHVPETIYEDSADVSSAARSQILLTSATCLWQVLQLVDRDDSGGGGERSVHDARGGDDVIVGCSSGGRAGSGGGGGRGRHAGTSPQQPRSARRLREVRSCRGEEGIKSPPKLGDVVLQIQNLATSDC